MASYKNSLTIQHTKTHTKLSDNLHLSIDYNIVYIYNYLLMGEQVYLFMFLFASFFQPYIYNFVLIKLNKLFIIFIDSSYYVPHGTSPFANSFPIVVKLESQNSLLIAFFSNTIFNFTVSLFEFLHHCHNLFTIIQFTLCLWLSVVGSIDIILKNMARSHILLAFLTFGNINP